jgi:hypothetical protein
LPVNIQYEFVYKTNYIFIKSNVDDFKVKLILSNRNENWRNELISSIRKQQNVDITFDYNHLVAISNKFNLLSELDWSIEINNLIMNFVKEFYFLEINYYSFNYDFVKCLTVEIESLRHNFSVDYFNSIDDFKLYIFGRNDDVSNFIKSNLSINYLINQINHYNTQNSNVYQIDNSINNNFQYSNSNLNLYNYNINYKITNNKNNGVNNNANNNKQKRSNFDFTDPLNKKLKISK